MATTTLDSSVSSPVAVPKKKRSAPVWLTGRVVYVIALLIIAAIFVTPYIFAIMAAFKPLAEINTDKAWDLPSSPTWANFKTIFTQYDFARYLFNTALTTVILAVGQVTFSLMGAYAFARMNFRGRDALFWVYLAMLMVPNVVTMIPLYVILSKVGILNTYWPMVLPYMFGVPYAVFLIRQYLMTIPSEVIEAARLDGCSEMRILFRVVVPMSRPILITATIIAVIFGWNNFLWPLIAVDSNSLQTLTVGIANFNSNFVSQWNLVLAGSLVALIPMVIMFVLFQKHIINSVNLTGASR